MIIIGYNSLEELIGKSLEENSKVEVKDKNRVGVLTIKVKFIVKHINASNVFFYDFKEWTINSNELNKKYKGEETDIIKRYSESTKIIANEIIAEMYRIIKNEKVVLVQSNGQSKVISTDLIQETQVLISDCNVKADK